MICMRIVWWFLILDLGKWYWPTRQLGYVILYRIQMVDKFRHVLAHLSELLALDSLSLAVLWRRLVFLRFLTHRSWGSRHGKSSIWKNSRKNTKSYYKCSHCFKSRNETLSDDSAWPNNFFWASVLSTNEIQVEEASLCFKITQKSLIYEYCERSEQCRKLIFEPKIGFLDCSLRSQY